MSKYIKYFETLEDSEGMVVESPFSGYVNNLNVGILSLKNGIISNGRVYKPYIFYTSSDNNVITPHKISAFGTSIISNTYNNVGILDFDGIVTIIGSYAFFNCYKLTSITIPNSITRIGTAAFRGCSSLTSVTIPNSVTSIETQAFYGCSSLTSINVDANNANYCSIDGVLFSKDKTTLIQYPIGNTRLEYIIPNSVTSIGDFAFLGCKSLTSIVIPNSVTQIGYNAFLDCSRLSYITCEATTPPTLGSSNNLANVTAVYVPAESVDLYKTATNWSYYSGVIKPIE